MTLVVAMAFDGPLDFFFFFAFFFLEADPETSNAGNSQRRYHPTATAAPAQTAAVIARRVECDDVSDIPVVSKRGDK